jgi:hypothetical protein
MILSAWHRSVSCNPPRLDVFVGYQNAPVPSNAPFRRAAREHQAPFPSASGLDCPARARPAETTTSSATSSGRAIRLRRVLICRLCCHALSIGGLLHNDQRSVNRSLALWVDSFGAQNVHYAQVCQRGPQACRVHSAWRHKNWVAWLASRQLWRRFAA